MELYLQFGWGMMQHSRELVSKWGGGTVVLSPRDLTPEQVDRFAQDIIDLPDGNVLFDPQIYLPYTDHERLCSHDYWPEDYASGAFWSGAELQKLLENLLNKNESVGSTAFILPGMHGDDVESDWLTVQHSIQEAAEDLDTDLPIYVTIALSANALRTEDQIGRLLEDAQESPADGYYLIFEHPNGDYLSEDPTWLANVLDITAGLRLLDADVVLGYCNHQMLVASAANATAICSGTYMNVRSFPPEKFDVSGEEEPRQRANWYYCPQALSEYKVQFLDFAFREGVLEEMAPPEEFDGGYVEALFSGTQPSTVDFTEQAAFRHYLHALACQVEQCRLDSFNDTVSYHEKLLDDTEELLKTLWSLGVKGQKRDFRDVIDVNRAALTSLAITRGPMLRRKWN